MHITVVGGGVAGLTAALAAAEAGARVTLYEAHHALGGRGRTTEGPYLANEGPHVVYTGPMWDWLRRRDLIGPVGRIPLRDAVTFRFRRNGAARALPPRGLVRLARTDLRKAPVDVDFLTWATGVAGAETARAAANFIGVVAFHHDPGSLSAAFVQERLRRVVAVPPGARYLRGGWGQAIERMARRAREAGVRIETSARVDALPAARGPVIIATSLAAARTLLGDDSLRWTGGRTTLVDLGLANPRRGRRDAFIVSDLDAPGWVERFSATSSALAPAGHSLVQAQVPIAPGESKADGSARAEELFDLGFPGWRERVAWRRDALAQDRTGALDLPGTTWRDRPAIDRGDGVFLAGDQVAAPGLLGEVAFHSGLEAAGLALRAQPSTSRSRSTEPLDLKLP